MNLSDTLKPITVTPEIERRACQYLADRLIETANGIGQRKQRGMEARSELGLPANEAFDVMEVAAQMALHIGMEIAQGRFVPGTPEEAKQTKQTYTVRLNGLKTAGMLNAIKALRAIRTGMGLAEAKNAVDNLRDGLGYVSLPEATREDIDAIRHFFHYTVS